jgi:hypothetical protein
MAGQYQVLDWDDKDPNEVINDGIEFGPALDTGDTILSATWTFINQAGVTKAFETVIGTTPRLKLSGGNVGETARLLCTVVTAGGETLKQVVRLKIKAKS